MFVKNYNPIANDNRKMIAPAVIGGIVAAVGAIASSAMSNSANKDIASSTNAYNTWMYQNQVRDSYAMTDYINQYNSPANQRKLLEDAGYNPALYGQDIASSMSSNGMSSSPSSNPAEGYNYNSLLEGAIGSGINAFQAIAQQQTNQENAAANTKNADTNAQNMENTRKYYAELGMNLKEQNQLIGQQRALVKGQASEQTIKNEFMSEYMENQIKEMKARTLYSSVQCEAIRIQNEYIPQEKAAKLSQIAAQIDLLHEQAKTQQITRQQLKAQIEMYRNQAYLLGVQADTASQLQPYEVSSAQSHASNMAHGQSDDWQTRRDVAPVSENGGAQIGVTGIGANRGSSRPSFLYQSSTNPAKAVVEEYHRGSMRFNGSSMSQPGMMTQ